MASSRAIIIEVDLKDNASGQVGGLKKTFAEIEARAQRTRNKLLQLGRSQFRVTLSLIDRITPAGSKINTYLRSMAAKRLFQWLTSRLITCRNLIVLAALLSTLKLLLRQAINLQPVQVPKLIWAASMSHSISAARKTHNKFWTLSRRT